MLHQSTYNNNVVLSITQFIMEQVVAIHAYFLAVNIFSMEVGINTETCSYIGV